MIEKIMNVIKKYKLAIFISLGIIIAGTIALIILLSLTNNSSIKEYKNENYSFKYDNSWKVVSKEELSTKLKHNGGSTLGIQIVELQDEYKYSTIKEMLDKLLYDIEVQNKEYKLISKKEDNITQKKYDGYKILYENGENQVMVVLGKKSDKLMIFTYEATSSYFDILLDSVQNIIYNFDTYEETFDLKYSLKMETTDINFLDSEEVENLLINTKEYELASKNYHIKYSIPDSFEMSSINSQYNSFRFKGLKDGSIDLTVSISNRNIYEHLDKETVTGVYSKSKHIKKDPDYSDFGESLNKLESNYVSYIYKNSYKYNKSFNSNYGEKSDSIYTSALRETVVLIYAIDKNHIATFEISSSKVPIPEKLINLIKITSSENYSSYSDSIKDNGYINSKLKRKTINNIEEVNLKVPEKYKELDKNSNIYEYRDYALNYDNEKLIYNYEVQYYLTSEYTKLDSQVKIYDNFPHAYGEYKNLTYSGDRIYNNKTFKVYDGGYTDLTGIMFTSNNRTKYYVNVKLLFYELPSGGYLVIKIKGNGFEINDDFINDLTNFEIKSN